MKTRKREKEIKDLFKKYGIRKNLAAKRMGMNINSLNVYMSKSLPVKYEGFLVSFLEEYANDILKDIKKLV